jgi:transcription elongation factor Elf1
MNREFSFTCPICGTKKDYPVDKMVKGALLECPRCSLKLTLHGHMWEEVEQQISRIKKDRA